MYFRLKNMYKRFGNATIFEDVNLELTKSGIYFLSGESGCGKTTLLNIIAGYERIQGERELSDDVSIACIFQSYELIEELNIRDNILLHQDVFDEEDHEYADMIISTLGLQELLEHYPKELSGGQKQRVGIARALLLHPNMIICDEPTESLDIENKEKVLNLFKKLSQDIIVIIASHEESLLHDYYDYHYKIINKKIEYVEERTEGKKCQSILKYETLNRKKANNYLAKIMNKSTMLYSLVLCFIMLTTVIFFQMNEQLFKEKEHNSAINYDAVYISAKDLDDDELKKYIESEDYQNVYVQVPFGVWNYKGKTYSPKIFPYMSNINKVEILGSLPKNNGLLINQYTANKMTETLKCSNKELIGKEIELSYMLSGKKYPLVFKVAGIADEQDVNGKMNIYYDYHYVKDMLNQQQYDFDMSHYDYFVEYHQNYAIQLNEKSTSEQLYYQLSKNDNIEVFHSVYSFEQDLGNQQQMYKLVFQTIQIIFIVLTVIYVFFYATKDTKKNITNLSILISLHIPMKLLKKSYIIKKISFTMIVMITVLIEILLYQMLFNDVNVLIQICYVFVSILLYIIIIFITLHRFQENKVSTILKDSKD